MKLYFDCILINVYKKGGKNGAYKSALKNRNINISKAIDGFDFEDYLPWDFIDSYPGKQLLINELERISKKI